MNDSIICNIVSPAFKTDVGKKRSMNEDAVMGFRVMKSINGSDKERYEFLQVLIVADGMGGHEKGEIASSIAISTFSAELIYNWQKIANMTKEELIKMIYKSIKKANEEVYNFSKGGDGHLMGTTFVSLINFSNDVSSFAVTVNAGDSRCYLIDDTRIVKATRDDSEVQEKLENGEISEEEAKKYPHRNRITNAIGVFPPETFEPTVKSIDICDYKYVLLCTDGLYSVVEDKEMLHLFKTRKTGKKISKKLVELANERGGPDNISLIIAKIDAVSR